MGVDSDYKQLANSLLISYTKGVLKNAQKRASQRISVRNDSDGRIIGSIRRILEDLAQYNAPSNLEKASDAIDLGKIYAGVDQREKSLDDPNSGYEDLVVRETLKYFKEEFFRWVNRPECPKCRKNGENIATTGSTGPPRINPDNVSVIELYKCTECNQNITFPRINNPVKLLETRMGRCGEWVNCFMLVLRAVVGSDVQTRYVWNAEDHVWCEYFSNKLKKWVHLDPCENVYDECSLYSKNWGKKMSWVLGIGENYLVDLTSKYVTEPERAIPKNQVANERKIAEFLAYSNAGLLLKRWKTLQLLDVSDDETYLRLYNEILLPQARERISNTSQPTKSQDLPKGRQTGDASWTAARGEDG